MQPPTTLLWLIFLPAFAYQTLSLIASLRQSLRAQKRSTFTPAVSILKPVRGLDPGIFPALVSQAQQDYPQFEILFGAADEGDPALPVIRQLQRQFPNVAIEIHVGSGAAGNLKTGVLINLSRHARYPIWLVADSDIGVRPGYLREVVAPLEDPSVGIVTCLYRPTFHSVPSGWEAFGIAVDFMPSALVAPLVGVREFGLGSTLCFRAADFKAAGGFEPIADYIADDYHLSRSIVRSGKRAHLSSYIVETSLGDPNWTGVWQHQLRWARTIRASKGAGFAGLPHYTHWPLDTAGWGVAAMAGTVHSSALADRGRHRFGLAGAEGPPQHIVGRGGSALGSLCVQRLGGQLRLPRSALARPPAYDYSRWTAQAAISPACPTRCRCPANCDNLLHNRARIRRQIRRE